MSAGRDLPERTATPAELERERGQLRRAEALGRSADLLRKLAPPARSAGPYPVGRVQALSARLAELVALWSRRPPIGSGRDAVPHIEARGHAVELIDELQRELYQLRARLVDEGRADGDERAWRVDLMLSSRYGDTAAAERLEATVARVADVDRRLVMLGYPEAALGHDPRCQHAAAAR